MAAARPRKKSPSVASRQEDRRERTRDAAMAIIERDGLQGLTAKRLASDLGVVPAALYRTYPSLDALKGALVIEALDALSLDLDASLAAVEGERRTRPERRLRRAIERFHAIKSERPGVHRLVDAALSSPEPIYDDATAASVETALTRALGPVVRALEDGVDEGVFAPGDAVLRAFALLAVAHGVDHLEKRDRLLPERWRATHLRALAVDTLLDGLRAPRAR